MNRRHFLALTAATLPALHAWADAPQHLVLMKVHPEQPGPTIPANFIGLSYEVKQLSDPTFFSAANVGLIREFRALSANGVLRLGGNTSDIGWWKATPASGQPPVPANVFLHAPPGEKPPMDLSYAITPEAVVNLRAFLEATGWTCIYGINLGSSTPARAAEEAEFVAKTLGPMLEYFQIGNEPDGFHLRLRVGSTWTATAYFDQWLATVNAIRTRVPAARFGVGDVSEEVGWLAPIADRLAAMSNPPKIAAVTNHYYFIGPPSNPEANLDNLLMPDPRVAKDADLVRAAAEKLNATFRMTEGNTCYQGGKPGFSDIFGAALWAADYALTLASLGYAGINLHGGSGKAVADSLGGRFPGEALMADPKAPHPRPFYTPIAQINGTYVAEPVFYGLKFAGAFAGTTLLKLDFDPSSGSNPVNATAFAARLPSGHLALAIVNKDATRTLRVKLPDYRAVLTLTASALTSTQVELIEHAAGNEISEIAPASAMIPSWTTHLILIRPTIHGGNMLPGITQRRSATASHGINHAGHQDIWRFFRIVVSGAACALTLFSLPSIAQTPTIDKVGSVGKTIPVDAYPVGRTEENSDRMYVYQWPGIHFLVAYKGSAFYFTVGNGKQHLRITVDGASLDPFVSLEPATYRIVTPGKSAHSVRIDTLNENLDGPKSIGAFSVAIGGQGLPVTARKRQIELIGDSFTVGAGNTSAIRDCDGEKAWLTTDTTQSFGADLAQHYDAQYEINAISGHGAIRNYNGSAGDTVPVAYPFLLRDKQLKYDDPRWEPSVIIVSLGTNDFSTPPHAGERWKTREEVSVDYQQASLDFLKEIRQRNPKALIVLWSTDTVRGIVAAETQKLAEALQRDGDHRVDFVNVPGLSFNACLSHPTTADDHTIAEAISKDIDMHGDVWR